MNRNYRRGYNFENMLVNKFKSVLDYTAVRTAGSHGAFDVVGMNNAELILVQCKTESGRRGSYRQDVNKLLMAPSPGAIKWFMVWKKGKGLTEWLEFQKDSDPTLVWPSLVCYDVIGLASERPTSSQLSDLSSAARDILPSLTLYRPSPAKRTKT